MLIALVLTLKPAAPLILPDNMGRATHAWFLNWVHHAAPTLAEELHQPNQARPFTVSNLWGGQPAEGSAVRFTPNRPALLRLTAYQPELASLLAEGFLTAPPQSITLAEKTFTLDALAANANEHPWAGQSNYNTLVQTYTLAAAAHPKRLKLRFASPTLFRSQGDNIPLPLPGLIFEGLAKRWNTFAPLKIHPDVRRFAEESMAINHYDLRTRLIRFGARGERGTYSGFVGQCSYAFLNRDRYWLGLIHLLGAFAFYAGVGYRTAMGLGQTRRLD